MTLPLPGRFSHPIVAVCTRCAREFHTASGPLGNECDVLTCRGLVHWIDRTRVVAPRTGMEPSGG